MKSWLNIIDATSEWTGKVASFLILPAIFVLLYEIVARYVFHAPTLWAHETSRHFYGVQFIVAGAYALRYNRHINTDVLVGYLSTRKRAIVDSILWTVFIFYCIILLWQGAEMAWVSFLRRETTQTVFQSPVWPVKLAIPIGAFLILMQGIAKHIRDIYTAITGRRLA